MENGERRRADKIIYRMLTGRKVAYLFAEAKEARVTTVDAPAGIRRLRHSNYIYLKYAEKTRCVSMRTVR